MIAPARARYAVGAHVRVLGEGCFGERGLCGTVRSAFESSPGRWAYGVMYDDHSEPELHPLNQGGRVYSERELEELR